MAAVLLFSNRATCLLPRAALAAILISSALGLFDWASLRRYYRVSKPEFRHGVIAMLGVMTLGVLQGTIVAVGIALLKLLSLASRPRDAIMGLVESKEDVYCAVEEEGGSVIPDLIIYLFDSSLVFFNAGYFKDRVHMVINQVNTKPAWFLFNAESV